MATNEENQKYEAEYSTLDLIGLIHEMKRLQNEKDIMEEALSDINKRYDYLRLGVIPSKMDDDGLSIMKIDGVGRVQLASDIYASIKGDMKEEAYQWLRDIGKGDVIKDSINPSTLKAMLKAMMAKGEEIPDTMFNVTPFTRASIVKA